jgi:oligoribonuclease
MSIPASAKKRLVWLDIETTGLNADKEVILEIGFKVTDLEFKTLDQHQVLIWDKGYNFAHDNAPKFVQNMHTESDLWTHAKDWGVSLEKAEHDIMHFLEKQCKLGQGADPLCGSSVHFDRNFLAAYMPKVNDYFHYRNIDVSTFKEVAARYAPTLESMLTYPSPTKAHRVMPDIDDSIAEFKFYSEVLF